MRLGFWLALLLGTSVAWHVRAQDADLSRQAFERGVELAEAKHWRDAALAFEESLAQEDRPGTRFNLAMAYVELGRPLDVTRHALAFLRFPPEPHRAEARQRVEMALEAARRELSRLDLQALPEGTEVRVDGAEAPVQDGASAFVLPGQHVLTANLPSGSSEQQIVTLVAGEDLPWPRAPLPSVTATVGTVSETAPFTAPLRPTPISTVDNTRWRTRLAWSFGVIGASLSLAAVATYGAALHKGKAVRGEDPTQPGSGFLQDADAYQNLRRATVPLAIGGGILMAAAIPAGPRMARRGSKAWAWTALGIGTAALAGAIALMVKAPAPLGDNTSLKEPTRYAGSLLLSAAAPLFSYSLTFALGARKSAAATRAGAQR